jgi:hypothetical protein
MTSTVVEASSNTTRRVCAFPAADGVRAGRAAVHHDPSFFIVVVRAKNQSVLGQIAWTVVPGNSSAMPTAQSSPRDAGIAAAGHMTMRPRANVDNEAIAPRGRR